MILGVFGPAQVLLLIVIIGGVIVLNVFYLLTLQNTLKEVDPSRRQVPPSNVWLMFIPLFSMVYAFILYPKISDSVKAEYQYRQLSPDGDFGRTLGITMAALSIAGIVPYIGTLIGLANFVILIIFWTKMSGYKNHLARSPKTGDGAFNISNSDLLDN